MRSRADGARLGSAPIHRVERTCRRPDQNDNLAAAELEDYGGTVLGAERVSADGRTLSATVSHPAFASRDWRCVTGGGYTAAGLLDKFSFPFAGYEPKELTPTNALTALKSELARRYGAGWERSGSWMACPKEEFFPEGLSADGDDAQALCEFRFPTGNRWRHGSVLLTEQFGDIVTTSFSSSTFTKAMRGCRPLRALRADRVSTDGCAPGAGSAAGTTARS